MNLRLLWCLVRSTNTCELLNLASSCLLVETLRIALLCLLYGNVDEDLDEGQWGVGVDRIGVELAGELTVGFVGRDEGGEGDCCGVGEEFGDLCWRGRLVEGGKCA